MPDPHHRLLVIDANDFVATAQMFDLQMVAGLRLATILPGVRGRHVAVFVRDRSLETLLRIAALMPVRLDDTPRVIPDRLKAALFDEVVQIMETQE